MTRQMTVAACRMKSSLSVDEFMVVARHMTGRICGGVTAIGLSAAVMFGGSCSQACLISLSMSALVALQPPSEPGLAK